MCAANRPLNLTKAAHVGVSVSDLELRYATVTLDPRGIDVIEFLEPRGERTTGAANRPGSMHSCFEVAEFDAVLSRMRTRDTHSSARTTPFGQAK